MSSPRPSGLPGWASGNSGYLNAVEPLASEKGVGFNGGESPPAGYHNWLFSLGYQWMSYFNDLAMRRSYWIADDFQGQAIDQARWAITGAPTLVFNGQLLATSGTAGELFFFASSGITSSDQQIGGGGHPLPTGGNFRWEARVRSLSTGFSGGGAFLKFGAIGYVNAGAGLMNAYVHATGSPNGTYKLVYGTGATPTSIDLGFLPPTGYQMFSGERNAGIFTLTIGSVTGGSPSQISVPLAMWSDYFGPFAHAFSSGASMGMAMDSFSYIGDTNR